MKVFAHLLACIAAIFLMQLILPNQVHYDSSTAAVLAGVVLWLINLLVRPIIKLVALPITLVTLGLFSLVINTLMVMLADLLVEAVTLGGFGPSFLLAILVSLLHVILKKSFKERR